MFNLKRDLISKINMHLLKNRISKKEVLTKCEMNNKNYCALVRDNHSSIRELDLINWWDKIKNENDLL